MPWNLSGIRLRSGQSWAGFGHHQNRGDYGLSLRVMVLKVQPQELRTLTNIFSSLAEISLRAAWISWITKLICKGVTLKKTGEWEGASTCSVPSHFRNEARATPYQRTCLPPPVLEELFPWVICFYWRSSLSALFVHPLGDEVPPYSLPSWGTIITQVSSSLEKNLTCLQKAFQAGKNIINII